MSAESDPVRVGIVGVGGIALAHMAALRSLSGASLVAVTDVDTARAREVARLEQCDARESLDDMLADPSVEAVIVCTPNMTHEQLGQRVLSSGRHLLMEKPLALTADGARALQAEARDRGLVLAVGHSHRFSDQSRAVHDQLRGGAIGTPRFARITMNGGWIWPGWEAWVLDPDRSGGHALHNGVHLTDLATWWLGEPATSVFAVGQHVTSAALDIHDYLVIGLGFASGASAVCEVSRGERPRSASFLELVAVGTEGVLTRTWDAEGLLAWTDTGLTTWPVDGSADRTFVRELTSFAEAIRGRGEVIPPVRDAVHAVEVAVAAERSLATAQTVHLGATS